MAGFLNAIFISYVFRNTYGIAKEEREKLKFKKLKLINYLLKNDSKIYFSSIATYQELDVLILNS